jgi:hypothetical protein
MKLASSWCYHLSVVLPGGDKTFYTQAFGRGHFISNHNIHWAYEEAVPGQHKITRWFPVNSNVPPNPIYLKLLGSEPRLHTITPCNHKGSPTVAAMSTLSIASPGTFPCHAGPGNKIHHPMTFSLPVFVFVSWRMKLTPVWD